jgi:hypothetical protein
MKRVILGLILALILTCAATAVPAPSVYGSRTAWNGAVSGVTTIDFDALSGNTYASLTIGNVTFDVPGDSGGSALWVSTPGAYTPIGSALVGNSVMTSVRGTFGTPVAAVGADLANLEVNDTLAIYVSINGTWSEWQADYTFPNALFWGIVAGPGEMIDGIYFSPTTSYWVGVDNFSFSGNATQPSIPEPAACLLMGSGMVLLYFIGRRRKS